VHQYEIFIRSDPERVWRALTDGELTQKYYFNTRVESDWQVGSPVRYYGPKGGVDLEGEILEIEPGNRLVMTFNPKWLPDPVADPSTLRWEVTALAGISQVTLVHSDVDEASFEAGQMHLGWVYGLSSLKSLLEVGDGLPDIFAS